MFMNVYYNTITPERSEWPEWLILVGYGALILVGIFPSNDIVDRRGDGLNGKIRTWNTVYCCAWNTSLTAIIHGVAAVSYLVIPSAMNIYLNIGKSGPLEKTYIALASISLVLTGVFVILSIPTLINDIYANINCVNQNWHIATYTIEFLALLFSSLEYCIVEMTLIQGAC